MTTHAVQQLSDVTDDFLRDYFAFYPGAARTLGLHAYDGLTSDLRTESINARIQALHQYNTRLQQIEPLQLEQMALFDYELLRWQIESELWSWTEQREHMRNPMFYTDDSLDSYVKRNYAPVEERAEAMAQYLQHVPDTMHVAQHHLTNVPRVLIEESVPVFEGLITFLNESLNDVFGGDALSPSLQKTLWAARDEAVAAMNRFIRYLRDDLHPIAQEQFAIGAEQFANMLRYNELVDLPLDKLLAIGEADLARNENAIIEVASHIDPSQTVLQLMQEMGRNHPPPDRLLEETRSLLEDLRSFLIEHDLVTIPSDAQCIVEETPPFARWAFAMMDTSGPFEERATESFYYVTLPEPNWPPEQVEGWLTKFDYATMTGVSIHEAYPGHFVHFMNVRHAPTRLSKVFDTYSHFESWAHYSEQMMLDQGYGNGDLHLRMSQLSEALVRNCRYICAIKMHTQGMSIQEATHFFIQHAYMDEVTATKEARRGTHDPGYINYTLGKLLLLKLLDDYKDAYGEHFSLKKFHDDYIGHGSPPIPLLRKLMLSQDNGELLL